MAAKAASYASATRHLAGVHLCRRRARDRRHLRAVFPRTARLLERRARRTLQAYARDPSTSFVPVRDEQRARAVRSAAEYLRRFNQCSRRPRAILVTGHYGNWEIAACS